MEELIYYSKNRKDPPFEVIIQINGKIVYINCNCPLGMEKKICRHKINAIRGDKEHRHSSTSFKVIDRLRQLFGTRTALRQHLEEKWRILREYANENPNNCDEIQKKRKILGEAFANGFVNDYVPYNKEPFDATSWENDREIYADGLGCHVTLTYADNDGVATSREVNVEEIFISDSSFYIRGYCHLRNQERTFRIDRIIGLIFHEKCLPSEKSMLLDVFFQGKPV